MTAFQDRNQHQPSSYFGKRNVGVGTNASEEFLKTFGHLAADSRDTGQADAVDEAAGVLGDELESIVGRCGGDRLTETSSLVDVRGLQIAFRCGGGSDLGANRPSACARR